MSVKPLPFKYLLYDAQHWHSFLLQWLLFGVLMAASWYLHPLFSLISFVPYFTTLFRQKKNFIYYIRLYLLNLIWNAVVSFWLCELEPLKGIGTLLINSGLFLLPVVLWQLFVRYGQIRKGQLLALLIWWLLFEYAHHIWDFSWTWLTIGNVFGQAPQLVLWYAVVGVLGGSAWILCCNYLLYNIFQQGYSMKPAIAAILFPMVLSGGIWLLRIAQPAALSGDIAVAGTTVSAADSTSDISKLAAVDSLLAGHPARKSVTVLPEVLLSNEVWLNRFPDSEIYTRLKHHLKTWNTGHIIVGALLNVPDRNGIHREERLYVETRFNRYNAALMLNDTSNIINIKLKKVYVPVEEYVPAWLSFLQLNTYGFSKEESNSDIFEIDGAHYFVGICYEAVNSIFVAAHLQQNTNAMLLLSSESFFGKSETGRKQYVNICRLRCIENNLPLVKSSNEGTVFAAGTTGAFGAFRRTREPYLLQTRIQLSTPSFYYLLVPYLFPLLALMLAGIVVFNLRSFVLPSGKYAPAFTRKNTPAGD